MNELSYIAKIKQALELANKAKTGCSLTLFDVIELKGYIECLEETIAEEAPQLLSLGNSHKNKGE